MFTLNEEELQSLSNQFKTLQSQLSHIESFAANIRARSKATNPIQTEDKNAFEQNLALIMAIRDTPSFKETCIQYLLNNLFQQNIGFMDVLNHYQTKMKTENGLKLYSKSQRETKISSAYITQIVIKTHPNFPYSLGQIIVEYIQIDQEIKECKKFLNNNINQDVKRLFDRMREAKDFSLPLYQMFIRCDRRLFVPEHEKEDCNKTDRPISLNYGVSLSAPHIHIHALKQFEHLLKQDNDGEDAIKFLDVGCGSGYIASLMAIGFVLSNTNQTWFKSFGCIYNENLLKMAINARDTMGLTSFLDFKHATTEMKDIGWKEQGPFDGIYCGAAIKEPDCILLRRQLKKGGYLMCVVEHPDSASKQVMKLIKRVKVTEHDDNEQSVVIDAKGDEIKSEDAEDKKEAAKPESSECNDDDVKSENAEDKTAVATNDDGDKDDEKGADDNDAEKDDKDAGKGADDADDGDDGDDDEKGDDNDNKNKNNDDDDYEVTDLFDVRFRTLRGRFQYLKKEESLLSDSEDQDSD